MYLFLVPCSHIPNSYKQKKNNITVALFAPPMLYERIRVAIGGVFMAIIY